MKLKHPCLFYQTLFLKLTHRPSRTAPGGPICILLLRRFFETAINKKKHYPGKRERWRKDSGRSPAAATSTPQDNGLVCDSAAALRAPWMWAWHATPLHLTEDSHHAIAAGRGLCPWVHKKNCPGAAGASGQSC